MAAEERKLLESWKEISAYLNRSVRTCRRLEVSLGLPVHRLDGTPRARVFAYPDELDRWLREKLNHIEKETGLEDVGHARKWKIFITSTLAFVVLAVGAALIWGPFSPAPGPLLPRNPSLAILPFENPAKDVGLEPWRTALADLLITDLVQSRYVSVVGITELYRKLIELKLGETDKFSDEAVSTVAEKAGVDYITTGSFAREGPNMTLTILVRNPKTPETARSFKTHYREEAEIFSAADELTKKIKLALNLTPRHVSRDIDRDVAGISTASPQAFKLYSQGYRLGGLAKYTESIPILQRAVELKPDFALAYKFLYRACQNIDRADDEKKYIQKAVELAGRLSERERGELEYLYYGEYGKNPSKQLDALKRLYRSYPQDRFAARNLLNLYVHREEWDKALAVAEGVWPANKTDLNINMQLVKCYQNMGWDEKAASVLREFISSNPGLRSETFGMPYRAQLYLQLNEPDKALAEVERLVTLSSPNSSGPLLARGTVYLLNKDFPAALGDFRKVLERNDPADQIEALLSLNDLRLMQGRVEEAKGELRRGIEIADKVDSNKNRAIFNQKSMLHQELSRLHQITGQFDEALKEIDEALIAYQKFSEGDPPLSFLHQRGLILLAMNRMEEFERVTDMVRTLADRWQRPKLMRIYYHLLGHRELKTNDPGKAVGHFWKAVDLVSVPGGELDGPDPEYFFSLAEATEAWARLDRSNTSYTAFLMYEKVTLPTVNRIHKGDLYALSFFRMAKYLENLAGFPSSLESSRSARAKAVERYRQFLALWGGADPMFAPLVEDARKRLAALESQ